MMSYPWKFDDETVYVSAGAWGIGRATVSLFARSGARVVFGDTDEFHSEELVGILQSEGYQVRCAKVDFADVDAWPKMLEAGGDWSPTVLISNAGISGMMPVEDLDVDRYDHVQAVNQRSALLGVKYIVPFMKRRGRGAIVLVGSVMSRTIFANSATYVATKSALEGLAKALAVDFGADRIRVNCVQPGFTHVGMSDGQREHVPPVLWTAFAEEFFDELLEAHVKLQPLATGIDSSDVANAIAFLCSDLAKCVTGTAIPIDGGLSLPVAYCPKAHALISVWTEGMIKWVQENSPNQLSPQCPPELVTR